MMDPFHYSPAQIMQLAQLYVLTGFAGSSGHARAEDQEMKFYLIKFIESLSCSTCEVLFVGVQNSQCFPRDAKIILESRI